jgi:hypothetical protein
MDAVQQYEDEVKETEIRLEQVKSELAGNGGEANPQENKLNLVEQLLKSAMMQTAFEAKETADLGGETPKGKDEETQPQQTAAGNKRQTTDSITIDMEIFMALVQAVQELKSPVSSKRAPSEDDEMIEALAE